MESLVILLISLACLAGVVIAGILLWRFRRYLNCFLPDKQRKLKTQTKESLTCTLPQLSPEQPLYRAQEQQNIPLLPSDNLPGTKRKRAISVQYEHADVKTAAGVPFHPQAFMSSSELVKMPTIAEPLDETDSRFMQPMSLKKPLAPRKSRSMPDIFAGHTSTYYSQERKERMSLTVSPFTSAESLSPSPSNPEQGEYAAQRKRRTTETRRRVSLRKVQTNIGKLSVSTQYGLTENTLDVTVLRLLIYPIYLSKRELSPFVRLFLLPGKKDKQSTTVKKNTLEPEFMETMHFPNLTSEDIPNYRVKFKVYNRATFYKNDLIGTTDLALNMLDLSKNETFSLDLLSRAVQKSSGHLMISLSHEAINSQLKVTIHSAKKLRVPGMRTAPDPYVTLMFSCKSSWDKQQTKVKKRARDPVFNETFYFLLKAGGQALNDCSLVVSIYHQNLMSEDKVMGHVILCESSPDSICTEHWRRIISAPHKEHAEWHALQDPHVLE